LDPFRFFLFRRHRRQTFGVREWEYATFAAVFRRLRHDKGGEKRNLLRIPICQGRIAEVVDKAWNAAV